MSQKIRGSRLRQQPRPVPLPRTERSGKGDLPDSLPSAGQADVSIKKPSAQPNVTSGPTMSGATGSDSDHSWGPHAGFRLPRYRAIRDAQMRWGIVAVVSRISTRGFFRPGQDKSIVPVVCKNSVTLPLLPLKRQPRKQLSLVRILFGAAIFAMTTLPFVPALRAGAGRSGLFAEVSPAES